MENLKELFSIPINLKLVVKVSDVKLYTSRSLIDNYIKSLDNQFPDNLKGVIINLVRTNRIIPCYLNKGILSVLSRKIFGLGENKYKHSAAFFSIKENKVIILIDNNINLFGIASDKWMASVTLHECVHMATFSDQKGFYKIFSKELINFYSEYFKELFKLTSVSEKDISKIVLYFLDDTKILGEALDKIPGLLSVFQKSFKGTSEEFQSIVKDYLYLSSLVFITPPNMYEEVLQRKRIIIPFYHTYRKLFGSQLSGFHFQEVVNADEVIAIYSEIAPREKMAQMLSLIK